MHARSSIDLHQMHFNATHICNERTTNSKLACDNAMTITTTVDRNTDCLRRGQIQRKNSSCDVVDGDDVDDSHSKKHALNLDIFTLTSQSHNNRKRICSEQPVLQLFSSFCFASVRRRQIKTAKTNSPHQFQFLEFGIAK